MLSSLLQKYENLPNFQLGYWSTCSTQHGIYYLHEKIVQALDNKEQVVAVLRDLNKALDTVKREV